MRLKNGTSLSSLLCPLIKSAEASAEDFLIDAEDIFQGYPVEKRIKEPYSILVKMLLEDKREVSRVTDIIGIRLFTEDIEEVYRIGRKILEAYEPAVKILDTLHQNHDRGYSSLDITVLDRQRNPVQVQIRTGQSETGIQLGTARHSFYKKIRTSELRSKILRNPVHYVDMVQDILNRFARGHKYNQDNCCQNLPLSEQAEIYSMERQLG